jgi:hypothetical protein
VSNGRDISSSSIKVEPILSGMLMAPLMCPSAYEPLGLVSTKIKDLPSSIKFFNSSAVILGTSGWASETSGTVEVVVNVVGDVGIIEVVIDVDTDVVTCEFVCVVCDVGDIEFVVVGDAVTVVFVEELDIVDSVCVFEHPIIIHPISTATGIEITTFNITLFGTLIPF